MQISENKVELGQQSGSKDTKGNGGRASYIKNT